MSGHNKWSKVKHKKAVTDAKKSKIFSKHAAIIAAESKKAGGDRSSPALKVAIENAKSENMPSENIERAIAKGSSSKAGGESVLYEIYGPSGVGIMVQAVTDNKNRTVAELRHLTSKCGGSFAQPGAVKWSFSNEGGEWIPKSPIKLSESDMSPLEKLVSALEEHDDVEKVITNASK
ncbi:MAG: YebC/PmpR family DNA-binding transcriptional regulator [Candidatus Campbellbacteria bacterium]|nr:YebC/PmpR family DNA-binding transcriptional regulator [Candidatus Campbellbacteria bacterium]